MNTFYPDLPEPNQSFLTELVEKDKKFLGIKISFKHLSKKDRDLLFRIIKDQPPKFLCGLLKFPRWFNSQEYMFSHDLKSQDFEEKEFRQLTKFYDRISSHYRAKLRELGIKSPGLLHGDSIFFDIPYDHNYTLEEIEHLKHYTAALSLLLDSYFGNIKETYFKERTWKFFLVQRICEKVLSLKIPFLDFQLLSKLVDIAISVLYPELKFSSVEILDSLIEHGKLFVEDKVQDNKIFSGQYIYTFPFDPLVSADFKRLLAVDLDFLLYFMDDSMPSTVKTPEDTINHIKHTFAKYRIIGLAYMKYLSLIDIISPVLVDTKAIIPKVQYQIKNDPQLIVELKKYQLIPKDFPDRLIETFLDVMNDVINTFFISCSLPIVNELEPDKDHDNVDFGFG
jgi:hypothetical protein